MTSLSSQTAASLTDQVTAWSTLAAVLVALALGVVGGRRSRIDRRAAVEEAMWSQASKISAWIETRRTNEVESVDSRTGEPVPRLAPQAWIVIQNASQEPVWDVTVWFQAFEEVNSSVAATTEKWQLGVLPPGAQREQEAGWTPPAEDEPLPMRFRDNRNVRWLRKEDGLLMRIVGGDTTKSGREEPEI